MLGYIVPLKAELKVRELEIYQAYYCGVCMSIKKRYGNLPRLTLSYDSAFLALVLSGAIDEREVVKTKRCIANPLKKRNIVYENQAVDYAADMMLLLAYYKFEDDYIDDKSVKALGARQMLKGSLKTLKLSFPEKHDSVKNNLKDLSRLEKEGCNNIDPAAEPFAKLMEEIVDCKEISKNNSLQFRKFGYHLGKWIFLIDAYDDIEKDIETGSYNPLVLQHRFGKDLEETPAEFKKRIKERIEFNLHVYLGELAKAYEDMNLSKNKGLIENIIYFGLNSKTDEVLQSIEKEETAKENM